jgi:hypothetical protein
MTKIIPLCYIENKWKDLAIIQRLIVLKTIETYIESFDCLSPNYEENEVPRNKEEIHFQ